MSYTSKFGGASSSTNPNCFGKQYDSNDDECRKECPFRNSCYTEWRKSYYQENRPVSGGPTSQSSPQYAPQGQGPQQMQMRPVEFLPNSNDVLPYEGEQWYSRWWWNSFSSALSAMGRETHLFFQHYRFPPDEHRQHSERRLPETREKQEERRETVDVRSLPGQTRKGEGDR